MSSWKQPFDWDSVDPIPFPEIDYPDHQIASQTRKFESSPYDKPSDAANTFLDDKSKLDDAIYALFEHPGKSCSSDLSWEDPFHFDWPFW